MQMDKGIRNARIDGLLGRVPRRSKRLARTGHVLELNPDEAKIQPVWRGICTSPLGGNP